MIKKAILNIIPKFVILLVVAVIIAVIWGLAYLTDSNARTASIAKREVYAFYKKMSSDAEINIEEFFDIPEKYEKENGVISGDISIYKDLSGKWVYNIGRTNEGFSNGVDIVVTDESLIQFLLMSTGKYSINSINIVGDQIWFWIVSDRLIYSNKVLSEEEIKEIMMAEKIDDHWYHAGFQYGI